MNLERRVEKLTDEEVAKRFGWDNDFYNGTMNWWQKIKPKVWSFFDEPTSSRLARVSNTVCTNCDSLKLSSQHRCT
jgi:potassium voltage-gated channel Shaw-related subfamily C protein 1